MFQEESALIWEDDPYVKLRLYNQKYLYLKSDVDGREINEVFFRFHVRYLCSVMRYPYTAQVHTWSDSLAWPSQAMRWRACYVKYLEIYGQFLFK